MHLTDDQKEIAKKWIEYCRIRAEGYKNGRVIDIWPTWREARAEVYYRLLLRWHRDRDIPSKVLPFKAPEKKKSK